MGTYKWVKILEPRIGTVERLGPPGAQAQIQHHFITTSSPTLTLSSLRSELVINYYYLPLLLTSESPCRIHSLRMPSCSGPTEIAKPVPSSGTLGNSQMKSLSHPSFRPRVIPETCFAANHKAYSLPTRILVFSSGAIRSSAF